MSDDIQKADQIAHRLYSKLSLVVNHARATVEPPPSAKVDKWFNLETPDPEIFKEHTRIYRFISNPQPVPLFHLQVLLCVPELATNQVLVYLSPDSSRVRIDPTPRYIVLESWTLAYSPHRGHPGTQDVVPSTMYKHGIPLFRSIFTLLRVLPAWKLARRLRRRTGGLRNGNFSIRLRIDGVDGSVHPADVLGFDTTPSALVPVLQKDRHTLPPIAHPMGELTVAVTYLTAPNFQLDTLESLLSSRFLSLEGGADFTPTLVKNQQRDSVSGSPGSLPQRTSLPRSPPRSVVDRFVIPPPAASGSSTVHAKSTSFSSTQGAKSSPAGSPRLGNIPLPVTRNLSGAGMGTSGVSDSSSIRQGAGSLSSREEVSALAARIRRESIQGRSSQDSPTGVPIRRTPITTVNAFKSSTISSGSPSLHSPSPSLRHNSPLSVGTGPSLPSRPAQSPTSSRVPPSPTGIAIGIGSGTNFPTSPVTPLRPSPPFIPSGLGSGRPSPMEGISASPSGAGLAPGSSPRAQGKRYSSSFGQRYAAIGAGGSGSGSGSGLAGECSPRGSPRSAAKEVDKATSFFGAGNTDDDDISAFVQEIDARKPLASRGDGAESPAPASASAGPSSVAVPGGHTHTRASTIDEESDSAAQSGNDAGGLRQRTLSMPYSGAGAVLATEGAVDARLREMNEAFIASLQGLGSRRRESSGATASASASASAAASTAARRPLDYSGGARRESPLSLGGASAAVPGSGSGSGSPLREVSASGESGSDSARVPLPPAYVRPRLASTGSVRSGFSIASEEVVGRMESETASGEERRSSKGPLGRDGHP